MAAAIRGCRESGYGIRAGVEAIGGCRESGNGGQAMGERGNRSSVKAVV